MLEVVLGLGSDVLTSLSTFDVAGSGCPWKALVTLAYPVNVGFEGSGYLQHGFPSIRKPFTKESVYSKPF